MKAIQSPAPGRGPSRRPRLSRRVLRSLIRRCKLTRGPPIQRPRAPGPPARRTFRQGPQRMPPARSGRARATLQTIGEPGPAAASASSAAPRATARPSLPVKGVSPLDFRVGDCFKDFDASAANATVVACTSGHSAQLVAVHQYPTGDSYPGAKAMKAKGREACQAAALTSKTNAYVLTYQLAYPSPDSWRQGDRRVDCYVTSASGNIIKASLLPQG